MPRRREYDAAALLDTTRTSAYRCRGGLRSGGGDRLDGRARHGSAVHGIRLVHEPPAANSPIGEYGLGWVATIVVSGLLYAVLPKPAVPAEESTAMAV
jgi:NCS1 family nucleobase:cation symporter-1